MLSHFVRINLTLVYKQMFSVCGTTLNDLVDASRDVLADLNRLPSESLECIEMTVYHGPVYARPSLSPFFTLCSTASCLRRLLLYLPQESFDSQGIATISNYLSNLPMLNHLSVDFHGYKDRSGLLLECLTHFVEERAPSPEIYIHFMNMGSFIDQTLNFLALGNYVQSLLVEGDETLWYFKHGEEQEET